MVCLQNCTNSVDADEMTQNTASHQGLFAKIFYTLGNGGSGLNICHTYVSYMIPEILQGGL